LLTHIDPVVRGRVAQVLKHLGWQPKSKAEEAAFLVALGDIHRAAMLGAVAVGPLTSVLGDTAYQRRVQAVNRLADIGDPAAVKPLIRALVDPDDVVRMAASDALGRLGDARAKNPLLPMLKDRNAGVRTAAAGAMGVFGDATLVDALIPLLDDPHWEVRVATLESLGRLHDNRATEAVARCLRDPDREVREKAAECLGMLGDPAAVGPLIAALVDADRFVRQWARLALQRVDPHWEHSPEAHAQIDLLRSAARSHDFGRQYAARETLRSLGDSPSSGAAARRPERGHAVADLIAGFLGDPDASVRQAAVEALVRLPGATPDHILQPLRHDPDASVATAALSSPSCAQTRDRPDA
jgi:HEAT repeat protein